MTTEETYEKLLADLRHERTEIERDMVRLADAYGEKMIEYRKVSAGIYGIEAEIEKIKGMAPMVKEVTKMNAKKELYNTMLQIQSEYMHAECFYQKEMLADFLKLLDKAKEISVKYYEENEKEGVTE